MLQGLRQLAIRELLFLVAVFLIAVLLVAILLVAVLFIAVLLVAIQAGSVVQLAAVAATVGVGYSPGIGFFATTKGFVAVAYQTINGVTITDTLADGVSMTLTAAGVSLDDT